MTEPPKWKPDLVMIMIAMLFMTISAASFVIHWVENPPKEQATSAEDESQPSESTHHPPPKEPIPPWVNILTTSLVFHGLGLFLTHYLIRLHKSDWPSMFGLNHDMGKAVRLGTMVGLACTFLLSMMTIGIDRILTLNEIPHEKQMPVQTVESAVQEDKGLELLLMAIVSVILAPLAEEVFFRGVIFKALKENGYRIVAWITTAILFAGMHGNLRAFLPLAVFSLFLTWVYSRTGNLCSCIVAHATFNLMNFLMILLSQQVPS